MIAVRLSVCGEGKVFVYNGANLMTMNDKGFLRIACAPHPSHIVYYELDRMQVNIADRFESDNEQASVKKAFTTLWELDLNQNLYDKDHPEIMHRFCTLLTHLYNFEDWEGDATI